MAALFRRLDPDFERLRRVLWRQGEPDRVPFIELFADREIMEAVIGEPIPEAEKGDRRPREAALLREIRFWYEAGYDYVEVGVAPNIPLRFLQAQDTAALNSGERGWISESDGPINSWQDFEAFPWPRPEDTDYFNLEFVGRHLPEGMKIIYVGGGQLEYVMWLMGYVPFALALKDDPALMQAVNEKVGELWAATFRAAAEAQGVGALWLGDDMGFKTGTMISAADLRRYFFPWQKKLAAIAHARNLPFLLHSCGNLREVIDDLVEDVCIDAKHSFEDAIQPVTEAKQAYGDRVALLGGIDVDFLCRHSEEEVRSRTRETIDACAPGGGWALGTGNSVANYIPLRNYLAMLDEGRKHGTYRS